MSEIVSFRDLDAWKSAMGLVVLTYAAAKLLPAPERFELASQMRRAAVSVPSNVAEGQANGPGGRYRHHVRIALGSWAELVTCVELVEMLEMLGPEALRDLRGQLAKTGQLLHGLDRSLRRKQIARGALALLLSGCLAALLSA